MFAPKRGILGSMWLATSATGLNSSVTAAPFGPAVLALLAVAVLVVLLGAIALLLIRRGPRRNRTPETDNPVGPDPWREAGRRMGQP